MQKCPFFHSEIVCDLYKSEGICWKLNGPKRKDILEYVGMESNPIEENLVNIYI